MIKNVLIVILVLILNHHHDYNYPPAGRGGAPPLPKNFRWPEAGQNNSNAVPAARGPNYLKSTHISQCLIVPHSFPTGFTSLWGACGAPHTAFSETFSEAFFELFSEAFSEALPKRLPNESKGGHLPSEPFKRGR